MLMLISKWNTTLLGLLQLAHNLHLDTLCANIVEHQLVSRGTLVIDSSTKSDLHILLVLSRLQRIVLGDELAQIVVDVELVWIWGWVLGLTEFIDGARSDLEILLYPAISIKSSLPRSPSIQ